MNGRTTYRLAGVGCGALATDVGVVLPEDTADTSEVRRARGCTGREAHERGEA